MGTMCSKNNAGNVTNDMPQGNPNKLSHSKKELQSQQLPQEETKFVPLSEKIEDSEEMKAVDRIKELAEKWCTENDDWTYTGTYKTDKKEDGSMISLFKVAKKDLKMTVKDVKMVEGAVQDIDRADQPLMGSATDTVLNDRMNDNEQGIYEEEGGKLEGAPRLSESQKDTQVKVDKEEVVDDGLDLPAE